MTAIRKDALLFVFGDRLLVDNVENIRPRLEVLLHSDAVAVLVLDLSQVRLCDSSGLRLLLSVQREADALSKKMILYRPERTVQELFEATRLNQVFTVIGVLDQSLQDRLT